MDLFDEEILKEKTKNEKKGTKIILAIIILLVILCCVIIYTIMHLKNSIITVTLDGTTNSELRNTLFFEENNSEIYIPVREVAKILGYESYNGEYMKASEDKTKCYIKSENEVVNIALNSNIITKKDIKNNLDYEKILLEEPIKEINGKLCTNIDGIEKICNINFDYDMNKKRVSVLTLQYLTKYYNRILPKYGYTELKKGFSNQKAVLNNIIIAKNSNEKYGAISADTRETILEPKYDDIDYLKSTNEFLITSNGVKGIISYNKEIIVNVEYSLIKEINQDLYLVEKNDNMGVITKTGETVIYPKYDYIGIENNKFKDNQEQGNYILLQDLIPIKENKKWAIFRTDGTQVTDFIYDSLGYIVTNDKDKLSIIYIEDYNVFIAEINKKYYLVTKERKECNRIWF